MIKGFKIPKVTFRVRTGDAVETDGGCAIGGEWHNATTDSYFKGKRVVIFSLPGAFTPTCSSQQLPGFEKEYNKIKNMGIDEIYCVSVNDSFVMNAWAKDLEIENVKMIPDSNGEFTRDMNMLVWKENLGFRSWRYAMVVNDMNIEFVIAEKPPQGFFDLDTDPYEKTKPEIILSSIKDYNQT